jgi:hypothetical protein
MRFRLNPRFYIQEPELDWLVHDQEYEGSWTPDRPTDPRDVRLFHTTIALAYTGIFRTRP